MQISCWFETVWFIRVKIEELICGVLTPDECWAVLSFLPKQLVGKGCISGTFIGGSQKIKEPGLLGSNNWTKLGFSLWIFWENLTYLWEATTAGLCKTQTHCKTCGEGWVVWRAARSSMVIFDELDHQLASVCCVMDKGMVGFVSYRTWEF